MRRRHLVRWAWAWAWCVGLGGGSVAAQSAAALKKQGLRYYAEKRWDLALPDLQQYQKDKPGDPDVIAALGVTYFHLRRPEQARQYQDYALRQFPRRKDPDLRFVYARTLHESGDYETAIAAYKNFLRQANARHPLRAQAIEAIRQCVTARDMPPNPNVALVENLGPRINTPGSEFGPLPSVNFPDRLYFSAVKAGATGGRRNDKGYEDELRGAYRGDMYMTRLRPDGWEVPTPINSLLNTARHERALAFSADGKALYFFRGFTDYSGDILIDSAGVRDEYAPEGRLFDGPLRPEAGDRALFFYNDSTLLFASRRDGGYGGLDLYASTRVAGQWTQPLNLGPEINSAFDDTSPFLALDGRTLYFSSNRRNGMGGFDIWQSVYDPVARQWSAPTNLSPPVNTPADELQFQLADEGRSAFLSSNRLIDNYGEFDLYAVFFKEQILAHASDAPRNLFLRAAESEVATATSPDRILSEAVFYENDQDLLSTDNRQKLRLWAGLAAQYPAAQVQIIVHTDETGPAKFDLYYGVKRAEALAKALIQLGVSPDRIALYSAGPHYPLARSVVNAAPNPAGQKLNRRAELRLAFGPQAKGPIVAPQRPELSELVASGGHARLDSAWSGLNYRVEAAQATQIIASDALGMFDDPLIESRPGESGVYRYQSGLFRRYDAARKRAEALRLQGFEQARVVVYFNGRFVSQAEAVGLLKRYPELAAYIAE
ncbi:MAG: OmpA family protein [Saprospiraceae bacterium]